jgi:hypothetical protein
VILAPLAPWTLWQDWQITLFSTLLRTPPNSNSTAGNLSFVVFIGCPFDRLKSVTFLWHILHKLESMFFTLEKGVNRERAPGSVSTPWAEWQVPQ